MSAEPSSSAGGPSASTGSGRAAVEAAVLGRVPPAPAPPDVVTPAPAAYRAALVLEALGRRRDPVSLTEVAAGLGLPKSSVANVLASLEAAGMVRRTPRGWLLGYKVLELSRSVLVSTDVVAEFARTAAALPALRAETVLLGVLEDTEVLYVARHDGTQPVRFVNDVGSRMPAAVTGLGKAMLAALPEPALAAWLERAGDPPRMTERSHRTTAALRADLTRSRLRGHAVDEEQNVPGVVCLAVAVAGAATPTAVSATMLARRATPEVRSHLVGALAVLAGRLSRLGSA